VLKPGETLSLTIEKPAAGGRMIARADGLVVLVSGAIPGEQVIGRVERVGRGVAYAEVVSVEQPSPDRRPALADPLCGGCLYSHIAYERQLLVKALVIEDAFARIGRLTVPGPVRVLGSPQDGYRMRARLHVNDGRIGFFREGTHALCDPRPTGQLRSDTCDLLDALASGLRSLDATEVREIELSENIDASQRVVHCELERRSRVRLAGLGELGGLSGLTVGTPGRGPLDADVLSGSPHVDDHLDIDGVQVRLRRHVLSFFQANRYLLPSLVEHVVGRVPPSAPVVDLYAGAGLFSIAAAAARRAQVTAVEGDRAGAADLAENAGDSDGRVIAVHAPVEEFVRHQRPTGTELLIVDPPRTGMSNAAIDGALALGASTIVYVSCDVATLARDAGKITGAGYALETVTGFDLFPNTPHVESVVTFVRDPKSSNR
jgi:tRNA/tmRNA/rRNA uracil-C5-methylase (TrmA/RlmC/RlmD family)